MNLWDVAAILGEIPLGAVKNGEIVLKHHNEIMPADMKITPVMTGLQIQEYLHTLSDSSQQMVMDRMLLTGEEVAALVTDASLKRKNYLDSSSSRDRSMVSFIVLSGLGSLALILISLLYYNHRYSDGSAQSNLVKGGVISAITNYFNQQQQQQQQPKAKNGN